MKHKRLFPRGLASADPRSAATRAAEAGHPRRPASRAAKVGLAAGLAGALAAALVGFGTTNAFADTLLSDDFQDGNSNGWSKSGGTWSVVTDGSLAYRQSGTSSDARSLVGASTWTDYSVQARVKPTGFGAANRYTGLIALEQSSINY